MCMFRFTYLIYKQKHTHMSKTYKIIHNLTKHTFPPELRYKVWQWLINPSNQQGKEESLRAIWNESLAEATSDTYRSLKKTQRKIKGKESFQKRHTLMHKLQRVAAILIIPLLSVIASYVYIQKHGYEPEMEQCFVPAGERQEITLPDGSIVNINSGSLLIYPKEFKGETRTLFLIGEANFNVRKDKEHPFIVQTGHLKVQALGTKFNVQAYSESNKITTTLESGSVKITKIEEDENSFILSPNEQLEYNYQTGVFTKNLIDVSNYSGWTKGELNFINQPLKEILATIKREYAVDFVINPRLFTPDLYTIKFRQHKDINTVMKILTMTVGCLTYEIDDNIIMIHSLKKKGVKQ